MGEGPRTGHGENCVVAEVERIDEVDHKVGRLLLSLGGLLVLLSERRYSFEVDADRALFSRFACP